MRVVNAERPTRKRRQRSVYWFWYARRRVAVGHHYEPPPPSPPSAAAAAAAVAVVELPREKIVSASGPARQTSADCRAHVTAVTSSGWSGNRKDAQQTTACSFYRAMLCMRGTSHGPVSVCLSVCLSRVGVVQVVSALLRRNWQDFN